LAQKPWLWLGFTGLGPHKILSLAIRKGSGLALAQAGLRPGLVWLFLKYNRILSDFALAGKLRKLESIEIRRICE
jgi:hypothetical protein